MIKLIKINFRLFFKNVYFFMSLLIFFIIVNGCLSLELYKLTIYKNVLRYLQYSQNMSILYLIFFTFISYEYLTKREKCNDFENDFILNKKILKLYCSKIIALIVIALIMTLNIFLYNFIVYIVMKIHYKAYLIHIILNNFLNIFLVSIFSICIGSIISLYLKRFYGYFLMIVLVILISPIFEIMLYVFYTSYHTNIYFLKEILNVLPLNLNIQGEALYGLAIEHYRWNLIFFWISFLSLFLILKLSKGKCKYLNIIAIILLIFSCLNLYGFTKQGSIITENYNSKNFTNFDKIYYSNNIQKEEKALFKVSKYTMKLNINRELQNDITISLDKKKPLKIYKFTLYRNYKIQKILGKNNIVFKYKRDGDYLEIINPTNKKLQEIRILYNGYSPVFYSNSQGVLLPGYFPYYPMEGYKKVYIKEENSFIPILRDYTVNFDISLKSNLDIQSNLNKNKKRIYGKAQDVTLMGGFLKEKSTKYNTFYQLVLDKIDLSIFSNIDSNVNSYNKLFLEDNKFTIKSKKIFQVPITLLRNVTNDSVVIFKDHILIPKLDKNVLVLNLIKSNISKNTEKILLSNLLFNYLLDKNNYRIKDIPKDMLNDPSFEIEYLFIKKINQLGESYVIKNTYKFLKNNSDFRDAITFIKNLN